MWPATDRELTFVPIDRAADQRIAVEDVERSDDVVCSGLRMVIGTADGILAYAEEIGQRWLQGMGVDLGGFCRSGSSLAA